MLRGARRASSSRASTTEERRLRHAAQVPQHHGARRAAPPRRARGRPRGPARACELALDRMRAGRHLGPPARRLPPLLDRRALARAPLREDALRQRPPAPALRRRLPRLRQGALRRDGARDRRLPLRRDARRRARRRLLRLAGRRLRGARGQVLRLDARATCTRRVGDHGALEDVARARTSGSPRRGTSRRAARRCSPRPAARARRRGARPRHSREARAALAARQAADARLPREARRARCATTRCWRAGTACSSARSPRPGARSASRPGSTPRRRAFAAIERGLVRDGRVGRYLKDGRRRLGAPRLPRRPGLPRQRRARPLRGHRRAALRRDGARDRRARWSSTTGIAIEGGFYFAPDDGEALIARTKDAFDQAIPSGAAMAALLCLRLGALVDADLRRTRRAAAPALAAAALENPFGMGRRCSASIAWCAGAPTSSSSGRATAPRREPWPRRTAPTCRPNARRPSTRPIPRSTATAAGPRRGQAGAGRRGGRLRVPREGCSAPVTDAEELAKLLSAP